MEEEDEDFFPFGNDGINDVYIFNIVKHEDLKARELKSSIEILPFECSRCLKRFPTISVLQQHERIHVKDIHPRNDYLHRKGTTL